MSEPVVVRSPAWILSGISNDPGHLVLAGGRLAFVSIHDGEVFDEPLERVTDVRFPWYWFSGGFTAVVGGTRRRISLTRPNGAQDPGSGRVRFGGELYEAAGGLRDVGSGRAAGKQWRALLAGHGG